MDASAAYYTTYLNEMLQQWPDDGAGQAAAVEALANFLKLADKERRGYKV